MKTPKTTLPTPRQRRSRQTLNRILVATERLLLRRSFHQLTIQEITRASRTSVGSFYNLFRSKEALLPGLYERYDAGLDDWIAEWRSSQSGSPDGLVPACAAVVRYLIGIFSSRRHLLRALALYVRSNPKQLGPGSLDRRVSQHRFLGEMLLEHRQQITHPDPEQAVRSAIFAAASVCRERMLFGESLHAKGAPQDSGQLQVDMTSMLLGLLSPNPAHQLNLT